MTGSIWETGEQINFSHFLAHGVNYINVMCLRAITKAVHIDHIELLTGQMFIEQWGKRRFHQSVDEFCAWLHKQILTHLLAKLNVNNVEYDVKSIRLIYFAKITSEFNNC